MIPDPFIGDWYGHITNQSGHFLLGVVALYFCQWLVGIRAGLCIIALGYGGWEVSNMLIGGYWWDSLEDAAYVAAGVGFALIPRGIILLWVGITLTVGAIMRMKQ